MTSFLCEPLLSCVFLFFLVFYFSYKCLPRFMSCRNSYVVTIVTFSYIGRYVRGSWPKKANVDNAILSRVSHTRLLKIFRHRPAYTGTQSTHQTNHTNATKVPIKRLLTPLEQTDAAPAKTSAATPLVVPSVATPIDPCATL